MTISRTKKKEKSRELPHCILEKYIPWVNKISWDALLQQSIFHEDYTPESFLQLKNFAIHTLPTEITQPLSDFHYANDQVALIIRNCPIDRLLPPTPYNGYLQARAISVACQVNLSFFSILELHPIVYRGENNGFLFRQVVPALQAKNDRSSHGSLYPFRYHVDNPDLPLCSEPIQQKSACPEYLSLYGMRCDVNVTTNLVVLDDILQNCDNELIELLQQPFYGMKRPDSFENNTQQELTLPIICKGLNNEWLSRFDFENTIALNNIAEKALTNFKNILENSKLAIPLLLLPGDFLIFKNQRILHARDQFVPRMDGTDRWLIRLFGIKDKNRIIIRDTTRQFEVDS